MSNGDALPPIPAEFERFTPRTARALVHGGYRSLKDLQSASDDELLKLRNFGMSQESNRHASTPRLRAELFATPTRTCRTRIGRGDSTPTIRHSDVLSAARCMRECVNANTREDFSMTRLVTTQAERQSAAGLHPRPG